MKQNYFKMLACAAVAAALSLGSVQAAFVYNDFAQYNGNSFTVANGQEIGNEITVNPGSTFSLSSFIFQYYTPTLTLSPNVAVDLRFYLNDGTPTNGFPTPGTLFFDSGWFSNSVAGGMPGNGYQDVNYDSSDFYSGATSVVPMSPTFLMPSNFTFTVTWTNLDGGNLIEMPLATNTPGISFGDYWLVNNSGHWSLMSTNKADANFVVDVVGQNPPSQPDITATFDGTYINLQIGPTAVGDDYIIQSCPDLTAWTWTSVSTNAGTGGIITIPPILVDPTIPALFFRYLVQ